MGTLWTLTHLLRSGWGVTRLCRSDRTHHARAVRPQLSELRTIRGTAANRLKRTETALIRLPNDNTLIATGNGHSVLEVTPEKKVVWQIHQHDLPNITLAWVTTLEVLPNGNYVIGNCHAGPDNPLLIEVEPKSKKVVWTFNRFNLFGNSAPNSQLLDTKGPTLR